MPLNDLLNRPFISDKEFQKYSFAHWQDHLEIIKGVKDKTGVSLTQYQIYPWNKRAMQEFLINHQNLHNDFNALFGLFGQDLQNVNLEETKEQEVWTDLNFREHQSIRQKLAI